MVHHVLLIDDDPMYTKVAEQILQKSYYTLSALGSAAEALQYFTRPESDVINAVLLDLSMPNMNGIEFLKIIRPLKPKLPIIVVTAHGDLSNAIEAMKAGANDFVLKQDAPERLQTVLVNAIKTAALRYEVARLTRSIEGQMQFQDVLGESPAIKDALKLAERAAGSDIPVLMEGESGVGKELFARAIHGCSDRASRPFIAVNCGAIPEHLAESILFGHEKGAFTGAHYRSLGKFREADGGTIFLDEVSELKPELQVKLLRVLQEQEVDSVGGKHPLKIDVRVMSASNRPLERATKEGKFREDLYYRLNVFPVFIPPLRNRDGDIRILAEKMLAKFAAVEGKNIHGFSGDVLTLMLNYAWPGNVRQLENMIFRAVVLADGELLTLRDFPDLNRAVHGSNANGQAKGEICLLEDDGNIRSLEDIEKQVISATLEHYNWHISEAARRLKLSRSTLYRKMHELKVG